MEKQKKVIQLQYIFLGVSKFPSLGNGHALCMYGEDLHDTEVVSVCMYPAGAILLLIWDRSLIKKNEQYIYSSSLSIYPNIKLTATEREWMTVV